MKKGPTKHCRTCLETFATSPSAVSRKYCSTARSIVRLTSDGPSYLSNPNIL